MDGQAIPVATHKETTRRHEDWRLLTSLANSESTNNEGKFGLRSKAWVMRSKKPAARGGKGREETERDRERVSESQ